MIVGGKPGCRVVVLDGIHRGNRGEVIDRRRRAGDAIPQYVVKLDDHELARYFAPREIARDR